MTTQKLLILIEIAGAGVAIGMLLSILEGVMRLIGRYNRNAQSLPKSDLLLALALATTPISKIFYSLIAMAILLQSNLNDWMQNMLSLVIGSAFAIIAMFQGFFAAKLIAAPTGKEGLIGSFRLKMALLGSVETFAIIILVGVIIISKMPSVA